MIIWNIPTGSTLRDAQGKEFVLTHAVALPHTLSRFRSGEIFCSVQVDGLSSGDKPYSSIYGEQYDWTVLAVGEGSKPLRVVSDGDYDYIIDWTCDDDSISAGRGLYKC